MSDENDVQNEAYSRVVPTTQQIIEELFAIVAEAGVSGQGEDGLPLYETIPFGSGIVLTDAMNRLVELEERLENGEQGTLSKS